MLDRIKTPLTFDPIQQKCQTARLWSPYTTSMDLKRYRVSCWSKDAVLFTEF